MKKFLSAVVAFGLVAGVAATASALELKVTGEYKVDGYWIDAYTTDATPAGMIAAYPWKGGNDGDWYQHSFKLWNDLVVNDKITIKSEIRLIDDYTIWSTDTGENNADGKNMSIYKLWLVYDSPIGQFEIGRRPGGAWGTDFVSSSTSADRIFWHLPTGDGPMKAYAFLEKDNEVDRYSGNDSDGPLVSGFNGADTDYYEVGVGYKTDPATVYAAIGTKQNDPAGLEMWRVKTWGKIAAGNVGAVVFETDYKFGQQNDMVDYNSYAALLAFAGKAGNVSYLVGAATISGDNDATDDENNAYDATNGTGWDFQPLYILTGDRCNVLNGRMGGTNIVRQSGAIAAVATADYAASEDLTLHGGLGWGMADQEPSGWDDQYGWEADLGMAYKLYQNLTYELHFGYWFVGDFAKAGGAFETDDVMLLSNHLTMKF